LYERHEQALIGASKWCDVIMSRCWHMMSYAHKCQL